MEHLRLGQTGLVVSRLCLGTMTFGTQSDEPCSRAILDEAFEHGVTFLDTGDAYPPAGDDTTRGRSEEIIGRWARGRRDDVIIATKVGMPMGDRPWDRGASRRHISSGLDASLRRLQSHCLRTSTGSRHPVTATRAAWCDASPLSGGCGQIID
jgi:aryl-alcohol dehydrogenase (NADP+)